MHHLLSSGKGPRTKVSTLLIADPPPSRLILRLHPRLCGVLVRVLPETHFIHEMYAGKKCLSHLACVWPMQGACFSIKVFRGKKLYKVQVSYVSCRIFRDSSIKNVLF